MTNEELYTEYVNGLQDSIEHKSFMLNSDKCFNEWLEERTDKLFQYYMDNPCLSNDIDYKPEIIRQYYWSNYVNSLTPDELERELNEIS